MNKEKSDYIKELDQRTTEAYEVMDKYDQMWKWSGGVFVLACFGQMFSDNPYELGQLSVVVIISLVVFLYAIISYFDAKRKFARLVDQQLEMRS